jgi:uncharacterized protein with gpF-like domain
VIAKYLKAILQLEKLGLKNAIFASPSQRAIKSILEAHEGLAAFQIDAATKALLSTDENWALASQIVAQIETALDMQLVSPGRDWIVEMEQRAYQIGNDFQLGMYSAMKQKIIPSLRGIDATTLKLIKTRGYEKIIGLAADQVEYLRTRMLAAVIENRTWTSLQKELIIDGKIPALMDRKGRLISMERRIETIVRTETSQIAEQGTRDKARELYGSADLACKWHTLGDDRVRDEHADRNEEIRLVTDWQNNPHPSDGLAILPGEDFNCRCWGEYGTLEELKKTA